MSDHVVPEWFNLSESATSKIMEKIAASVASVSLPLQVKNLPMQAHWFVLDSLMLANRANREGMHANSLALTRQCLEALTIIEVGICRHEDASEILHEWEADKLTAGKLRIWLAENVWIAYGSGLWSEPWNDFMAKFAKAIQPYAHYTSQLSQWQQRLHGQAPGGDELSFIIEYAPRAYDPQKATRITLYHAILVYVLARIWIGNAQEPDHEFESLIDKLRIALGKSRYLDGHQTNWEQQFWALVWSKKNGTILE